MNMQLPMFAFVPRQEPSRLLEVVPPPAPMISLAKDFQPTEGEIKHGQTLAPDLSC